MLFFSQQTGEALLESMIRKSFTKKKWTIVTYHWAPEPAPIPVMGLQLRPTCPVKPWAATPSNPKRSATPELLACWVWLQHWMGPVLQLFFVEPAGGGLIPPGAGAPAAKRAKEAVTNKATLENMSDRENGLIVVVERVFGWAVRLEKLRGHFLGSLYAFSFSFYLPRIHTVLV